MLGFDSRDQFAVTKESRAALAKADVGAWIEFAVTPEAADLQHAFSGFSALLENHARNAALAKPQGCEEACGPGSDDDHGFVVKLHARHSDLGALDFLAGLKDFDRINKVRGVA